MEQVEFADLNRLSGILKNSKNVMDKSKMPAQNKKVFEGSTRANGFSDSDYDLDDEKPMPNLTEDYYARMTGTSSGSNGDIFEFDESGMNNSKLPKAVLEVMKESRKDRLSLHNAASNSLPQELINEVNGKKQNKQKIQETVVSSVGNNVDYSLIKTIVEDCMKKYVGSLKKTLMTENKGNSLELMTQQGNTFRFVTADGKLFEGKLTYKGKVK